MAKFDLDKVYSELDKVTVKDLYETFQSIKTFVQKKLEEEQRTKQDEASELQSKIEKL